MRIDDILNDAISLFSKHHKVIVICAGILYRILLDLLYIFAVNPMFDYFGSVFVLSEIKYVLSWILYLTIFILLPKEENSVISVFLNFQFIFTIAPLLVFYGLANQSTKYILMVSVCIILQIIILRKARKILVNPPYINRVGPYVMIASGLLILLTVTAIFLYNGFAGTGAMDLAFIYDIRRASRLPVVFTYLSELCTKAMIPFFFLYFLYHKKYLAAIILFCVQMLLYLLLGHKFILFILPLLFCFFVLAKFGILVKFSYILFGLCSLGSLMTYLLSAPFSSTHYFKLPTSLFAHRMLFVPAMIKFQFYDVFSELPFMFFGDGQIGRLFSIPSMYPESVGRTIWAFYREGDFSVNANTGYLADSYAQMGFAGMIIISILVALTILAIHNLSNSNPKFIIGASIVLLYTIIFNDGAFFTIFLTSGLWFAIILLMIFLRDIDHSDKVTKG